MEWTESFDQPVLCARIESIMLCFLRRALEAQVESEVDDRLQVWLRRSTLSEQTHVFCLAASVYGLLKSHAHATQRDLFYCLKPLGVTDQRCTNQRLQTLGRLLNAPREALRVDTCGKGVVVGDVSFDVCDGSSSTRRVEVGQQPAGVVIASDMGSGACNFATKCRFVLVVEKEASLTEVLEERVAETLSCLLVCGKGYPDVATRRFLRRLADAAPQLPIFALVDCDPHGLEILLTYCFGSAARKDLTSQLCVERVLWVGVRPSHLTLCRVHGSARMPMTIGDKKKLHSVTSVLESRAPVSKVWGEWLREAQQMHDKVEIQGLKTSPLFSQKQYLIDFLRITLSLP